MDEKYGDTKVEVSDNQMFILKCNAILSPDMMKKVRDDFMKQIEEGFILLPCYCDLLVVPKGTDVNIIFPEEEETDGISSEG